MHIRNQKDFWSGVMFAAFGLFFAGFGTRYTFGSAARMGPGYFPTVLGVILVVMGVGMTAGNIAGGYLGGPIDLRFELLIDVAGVDYMDYGRSEWRTQSATSSGLMLSRYTQ